MTTSEPSSPAQPTGPSNRIIAAFLAASAVGFIDAAYLTAKHYLSAPVTCSILRGCEQVTTSAYAAISGIPVALLGSAYYLFIFLLVAAYYNTRRERTIIFASYCTIVGLSASLWFLYLQLFIIHALCLYCLISALASAVIFALGAYTLTMRKKPHHSVL